LPDRDRAAEGKQYLYAYHPETGEVVCDGFYEGSGSIAEFLISAAVASRIVPCGAVPAGNDCPQYSQGNGVLFILLGKSCHDSPRYSFLPTFIRLHALQVKWKRKAQTFISDMARGIIG